MLSPSRFLGVNGYESPNKEELTDGDRNHWNVFSSLVETSNCHWLWKIWDTSKLHLSELHPTLSSKTPCLLACMTLTSFRKFWVRGLRRDDLEAGELDILYSLCFAQLSRLLIGLGIEEERGILTKELGHLGGVAWVIHQKSSHHLPLL